MARKVFMIAPFEALTGNLSGEQDLQYAENNNPAYEAPNGTQYARNYKTRYVGNRRGKDGLVYFQVKQSTATVLTASSRRTMAVLGVTAAIRSALVRNQPTLWERINDAFAYLKEEGRLPEGQDTFNKWFSANIKQMLLYKRATWAFTYVPLSFTIHNPYDPASAEALLIKNSIFVKFANWFAWENDTDLQTQVTTKLPGGAYFTIDAHLFFITKQKVDNAVVNGGITQGKGSTNPNMAALYADVTIDDSQADDVLYNGMPVYNAQGQVQQGETPIIDNEKLTTAAPES